MEPIRVLIADDHRQFREGLRGLLLSAADLELVGEAQDGKRAIALATELQPDVILMDLQMPDVSGIDATRRILSSSPHISVLVLSMFDDDDSIFAALQAGARGYLLKGALKAEILRAIRAVASGDAIFGPVIAKRLINYFAAPRPSAPADAFPELTEREKEILALVAQHQTNLEDRAASPPEPQDHPQPCVQRLHQAAGRRPSRGHHPGPPGGVGESRAALDPTRLCAHTSRLRQHDLPQGRGNAANTSRAGLRQVDECAASDRSGAL